MTILSYIATAVISAKTAVEYLNHGFPYFNVMYGTIAVLVVFALLCIIGISESAKVALAIFAFHLVTMTILAAVGLIEIPMDLAVFRENLQTLPSGNDLLIAMALGFSAALLGVSGFESSANFVEEQAPGVFRKTLRNMLIAVAIFSPLLSVISLNLLPLDDIVANKDYLLAEVASVAGGPWLLSLVAIDALLVLSGAVLTGFVGVTGLVRRMALDQCLPKFFLKQNRRGTYHRIIIAFCLLCISILLVTKGHLLSLAGVYAISFLAVMTLFGIGDILLKVRRKELKRTHRAGWPTILVAIAATSAGIVGNIAIDYRNLYYFLQYFVPTAAIIALMYVRIPILRGTLQVLSTGAEHIASLREEIIRHMDAITNQRIVLFVRHSDLHVLHNALEYILHNEASRSVVIVHLHNLPEEDENLALQRNMVVLEEIFPDLRLEYVERVATFGPATIDAISEEFQVPKNNIFIGAPEHKHNFSIQDLGGVRVIF